jgi:thiol:disulfide interchange protein
MIPVTNLEQLTQLIDGNDKVIVNFTAPGWCLPCRRLEPHFKSAAEADTTGIVWVVVDLSTPDDDGEEIMTEHAVQAVPSIELFLRGEFAGWVEARTAVGLLAEVQYA